MASDQGLQCLQTGFSIKNRIKETKKKHDIPKLTNEFVQDITVCGRVHQLQVSDKFKKKKKKLFHFLDVTVTSYFQLESNI